jgi:D-glucosaminate-6-phosphate ammonia-lyase
MTQFDDAADIYRAIGVTPAINASGTTTAYGGTKLRSEVMDVMNKASTVLVDIHELNRKVGALIAEAIGAEAAFVCSGSAGGLVLQAAACIAGSDPARMSQLPDTTGLKDEIIIQNSHRFAYDQAYRVAGAKLVGVGTGRSCHPWQLEAAYTEQTAAVAYLFSPFLTRKAIPLEDVCESAHARGVPVIVDAASMLPPRENLHKYLAMGADMVVYSGGKSIRGPQGTGILAGRADLIEAAVANAAPGQFLGRGMKVAKEEVVGLLHALQIFMGEDEEAENERFYEMGRTVVDALIEIPGIDVEVRHDRHDYHNPIAIMTFTDDWNGASRDEITAKLADSDPRVYLHTLGNPDELGVDPTNLSDEDLDIVIKTVREVLLNS